LKIRPALRQNIDSTMAKLTAMGQKLCWPVMPRLRQSCLETLFSSSSNVTKNKLGY